MSLTLTENKENALLQRREVQGTLNFSGSTPSNKDLTEAIAKQLHTQPELVVVKHIHTAFGRQEAAVEAFAYASPEARKRIEVFTKALGKKTKKKAKGSAEAQKKPEA